MMSCVVQHYLCKCVECSRIETIVPIKSGSIICTYVRVLCESIDISTSIYLEIYVRLSLLYANNAALSLTSEIILI